MRNTAFALVPALALLGLAAPARSQAPPPSAAPVASAALIDMAAANSALTAAPSSFRVGPGDVLSIQVLNLPALDGTVMVSPDGGIRPPYLTAPLPVAGETADQIARRVARLLKSSGQLVDPQVAATVVQVRSRPIVISGGVRNAVVLQAVEPIHLLDALVAAGGVYDSSASDVTVSSPATAGAPRAMLDLPIDKVLAGAAQYNPILQAGDIVQVLPGSRVFIAGDVKSPGAIPLSPSQQLHITQVLALVGSWNRGASAGQATLTRRQLDGTVTVIPLDLPKIMARQQPDLVLQANDLLYVPGDTKRQIALAAATGIGSAAMLGIGYLLIR